LNDGTISINKGDRVVTMVGGTPWNTYLKVGDYFNAYDAISDKLYPYLYRILYIGSDSLGTDADTKITLAETFVEDSISTGAYRVIRFDTPNNNISNIMDIMPTYGYDEFHGLGADINLGTQVGTALEVRNKEALQGPQDTIVNDFQLGLTKPSTSRGRAYFKLSGDLSTVGKNSFIKLGVLTPYIKYGADITWSSDKGYKKVYQAYLYNKAYVDNEGFYRDLTGKIYMLIVSGETNQGSTPILLNGFSDKDVVDIFELAGRPIIKTI
jgi:hypothetical protein